MNHTTRDDLIGYVERDMVRMTLHETIREHVENGGITGYDFTYHEDTYTWTDDDDTDDEPQHHDTDDMCEYMQDDPAQLWLDDALEVRVNGYRSLYGDDFTWTHVSVLLTVGGPNIWADWDGSRWHFHGHWGGEEVHRYMGEDDMGVGSYLTDYAEHGY